MSPRPPRCCANCRHWDDLGGTTRDGQDVPKLTVGACRVRPPVVQPVPEEDVPETLISGVRPGLWPMTRGTDVCGEIAPVSPPRTG